MAQAMADETKKLFMSIGLSENKALETLKNETLSEQLKAAIEEAQKHCSDGIDKATGNLLYHVATKLKKQVKHRLAFLTEYVASGNIATELQLTAALEYLLHHAVGQVNVAVFEEHCGVGVSVTPEDIENAVEELIQNTNTVVGKTIPSTWDFDGRSS
ncbi:PREDICTED: glutamine--tRNA ligase-like [Priapulus caudatus]|uniref:Glutamine--tRNA ligase-like n=1 Tax=Priapulus caudatus TaxID=37621 RepID=A0ABM1DYF4_PRICU|nr:PREDICTED: glutamine--tRNA ligase-like [Priapulus caudatus]